MIERITSGLGPFLHVEADVDGLFWLGSRPQHPDIETLSLSIPLSAFRHEGQITQPENLL